LIPREKEEAEDVVDENLSSRTVLTTWINNLIAKSLSSLLSKMRIIKIIFSQKVGF
jgi:hypothetical protein